MLMIVARKPFVFYAAHAILAFETVYLFPVLLRRIRRIIEGEILGSSFTHVLVIISEAAKVVLLLWTAWQIVA